MIINVNDLQMNFQVFGAGPPLVILHGWGDNSSSWQTVAELLASRYQVFVVDLPGFGGSDAPPVAWSVDEYREVIEGFISEMELESPVLMGHSHGGKIACELILHGLEAKALILVASSGLDLPGFEVRLKIYSFKLAKWLLLRCGSWGQKKLEELRGRVGSRDYQEAGALRDTMVKVVNHKLFDTLSNVKVPTLIIWGSKDSTLPMEQAKLFRKLIPASYIRVLWDATHHPHLEQALELSEIVTEFSSVYEQQVLS